jgi:hypothetical protein
MSAIDTQGAVTVGDLTAAIDTADDLDLQVAMADEALWASELSGHVNPRLADRRNALLRRAADAWTVVAVMSSTFGDDDDPTA